MEDPERDDDWTSSFQTNVDIAYERRMQESEEWLEEGHFLTQGWYKRTADNVNVELATARPLLVHTHIRGTNGESVAHDSHPMIALVHLLQTAPPESEVYISIPFLTDYHVIDQLARYAKPTVELGRKLTIRIILGPCSDNVETIQAFVGTSLERYWSVQRLQIRQYGVMGTAQVRAQYMHSKAVIGSELGMIGSYNYTYASRFRHAEDGFVFDESSQLDCHRERLRLAWENGTVVTIDKPSATTRKAGPVLFGGQGEPKEPKISNGRQKI